MTNSNSFECAISIARGEIDSLIFFSSGKINKTQIKSTDDPENNIALKLLTCSYIELHNFSLEAKTNELFRVPLFVRYKLVKYMEEPSPEIDLDC